MVQRIQVVATGVAGSPWYTSYYANNDGSMIEWREALNDLYQIIRTATVDDVTYTISNIIQEIDNATGDLVDVEVVGSPINLTGTSTNEPLPFQVSTMCSFTTSGFRRGRNVKGRVFLNGHSESESVSGYPAAGLVTGLGDAFNQYVSPGAGDFDPVIYGRPLPARDARPALPGDIFPITGSVFDNQFHSLRSRATYS